MRSSLRWPGAQTDLLRSSWGVSTRSRRGTCRFVSTVSDHGQARLFTMESFRRGVAQTGSTWLSPGWDRAVEPLTCLP